MIKLNLLHCSPVPTDASPLTEQQFNALQEELTGWKTVNINGELRLEKTYRFKDFNQALAFTNRVGELANLEDHHPAILTEWGKVTVTWWTHKIKGLHKNDFIMAARTEQLYDQ